MQRKSTKENSTLCEHVSVAVVSRHYIWPLFITIVYTVCLDWWYVVKLAVIVVAWWTRNSRLNSRKNKTVSLVTLVLWFWTYQTGSHYCEFGHVHSSYQCGKIRGWDTEWLIDLQLQSILPIVAIVPSPQYLASSPAWQTDGNCEGLACCL